MSRNQKYALAATLAVAASIPTFFVALRATAPMAPLAVRPQGKTVVSQPDPPSLPAPLATMRLERGDTLGSCLQRLGLESTLAHNLIEKFSEVVDPRKVRAGSLLSLRYASDGAIRSVSLERDTGEFVGGLERQGETLVEAKDPLPVTVTITLTAATINGSLWATMKGIGERPDLAIPLSNLFQWQLDFNRDLQPGDRFALAVEKRIRGGGFLAYGRILAATMTVSGKHYGAVFVKGKEAPGYFDRNGKSLKRSFLKSPVAFTRISSRFSNSRLHPVLHIRRPHHGVDYAAPAGTPVRASGDGKILSAGRNGGLGNCVKIGHRNGVVTQYGHLRSFARGIHRGVRVVQGQVIGYVGQTGLATGPHLDFRFLRHGRYLDPLKVVDDTPPATISQSDRPIYERVTKRWLDPIEKLAPGERKEIATADRPSDDSV